MVSHRVRVPFRLGVFLGLGNAEQIAGAGDQDEEIVADDDEPGREISRRAVPGRSSEPHRMSVAISTLPPNAKITAEVCSGRRRPKLVHGRSEIERRPRQLGSDQHSDRKSGDAPDHRHDGGELDRTHIVVGPAVDLLRG